MVKFTLTKTEDFQYVLKVKDVKIHEKRFLEEVEAYEYYKAFISSWLVPGLKLEGFTVRNVN